MILGLSRRALGPTRRGGRLHKHTLIASGEITRFKKCKFQGHCASIETPEDVAAAVAEITAPKRIAKATHPAIHAWRCGDDSGWDDSGESGAGRRLLKLLEDTRADDTLVAVTRWYGGSHLGSARFRAISSAAKEVVLECGRPTR